MSGLSKLQDKRAVEAGERKGPGVGPKWIAEREENMRAVRTETGCAFWRNYKIKITNFYPWNLEIHFSNTPSREFKVTEEPFLINRGEELVWISVDNFVRHIGTEEVENDIAEEIKNRFAVAIRYGLQNERKI
jgi:hypothetical protein